MATRAVSNGYEPIVSNDFSGGLNLRDKSDDVSDREAIDLLNVNFAIRGAIHQRDGYVDFTQDLAGRVQGMAAYARADGLRQLVAATDDGSLLAIGLDGFIRAALTGRYTGNQWSFVRHGDSFGGGHEWLFCANGFDPLARWDGSSWVDGTVIAKVNGTAGMAMPRAGAVCTTAPAPGPTANTNAANRLVATAFGTQTNGGPGGTASTPSRVYLSNSGDPLTWETDNAAVTGENPNVRGANWIDFTPGDGEYIAAAVSWRELTFVFKQSRFFVIWGEGQNLDGTPAFQYREVNANVGAAAGGMVAVGRDGVYFSTRRGVYLTNGGEPKLLSEVITPMWTQDVDIYFTSKPINMARLDRARAHWHNERFYLAVPTGASDVCDRVLIYDAQRQWWSLYDVPVSAICSFAPANVPQLTFGYSKGPPRIGLSTLGETKDRGVPIDSYWRSGWADFGASQQKVIRETKLWGCGSVTVSFSVDFSLTQRANIPTIIGLAGYWPTGGTWDEWLEPLAARWPTVDQNSDVLVRYARRGTLFSTQFASNPQSTDWGIHRVANHLREMREASIR